MSPIDLPRQKTSDCGVGHPVWIEIATASGRAARTVRASVSEIRGRRLTRSISSSSINPIWIGVRRTWNAFVPIIASAMFSFT